MDKVKDFLRVDLILLPLKILYFNSSAAWALSYTYYRREAKEIGITKDQLNCILLLTPIASTMGSCFAGPFCDRSGYAKRLYCGSVIVNALSSFSSTFLDVHEHGQLHVWIWAILSCCTMFSHSFVATALEAMTVDLVRRQNGKFGYQIVFGPISNLIFTYLGYLLVHWMKVNKAPRIYELTTWTSLTMHLCSIAVAFSLETKVQKKNLNWSPHDSLNEAKKRRNVFFLITVTLIGFFQYFIDTYSAGYLTGVGASDFLLSSTHGVFNLASIPLFLVGDVIVSKLGHERALLTSLLLFSVRMLGYEFLEDPVWSLPLQVLKAIAIQIPSIASSMYGRSNAPPGSLFTFSAIRHGSRHGLGRFMGNLIGGSMLNVSYKFSFGVMAAFPALSFIALTIFYERCLKHTIKNKTQGGYPVSV